MNLFPSNRSVLSGRMSTQRFAKVAASALFVLAFSVLATENMPYQTTSPSPPPPLLPYTPTPDQKATPLPVPSTITQDECLKNAQVCRAFGGYGCCPGLTCSAVDIAGLGVCLPQSTGELITKHKGEQATCMKEAQYCNVHGGYPCCGPLECFVDPITRLGICLAKPGALDLVPTPLAQIITQATTAPDKTCKDVAQLCNTFGPSTCCPGEGIKCFKVLLFGIGNIGVCALDLPLPIYNGIP